MRSIIKYTFIVAPVLLVSIIIIIFFQWSDDKHQYFTYIEGLTGGFVIIILSSFFFEVIENKKTCPKIYLGAIFSFIIIYVSVFYGSLIFSLFSPFNFIDESCRYNKSKTKLADFALLRVFYKESIDYFKYQFPKKEEDSSISMEEFCKEYKGYVGVIAQKSEVDYNDNIVNSIAFDIVYLDYFYRRWDIGEIEYNKIRNKQEKKLNQHLSPNVQ